MKKCKKCGTEYEDLATYCNACEVNLDGSTGNTDSYVVSNVKNDYKTSIQVALLVSLIGWIAVIAGIGFSLMLVKGGGMAMLGLPSAVTVALVGLLLVIGGQASRAVMDNSNYSRQMLHEMQKRNNKT